MGVEAQITLEPYCSAPIIVDTFTGSTLSKLILLQAFFQVHFARDKIINSKYNDTVDVLSSINNQNIVNTVIQNKNDRVLKLIITEIM